MSESGEPKVSVPENIEHLIRRRALLAAWITDANIVVQDLETGHALNTAKMDELTKRLEDLRILRTRSWPNNVSPSVKNLFIGNKDVPINPKLADPANIRRVTQKVGEHKVHLGEENSDTKTALFAFGVLLGALEEEARQIDLQIAAASES